MKVIELSNGGTTLVDDADYELVAGYRWSHNGIGYAQASVNGRTELLHRWLMNAQKGQELDHINRNKLDNRRENLRFVSHAENMRNMPRRGARGTERKSSGRWAAKIWINGRYKHIGTFDTEEEARGAYRTAVSTFFPTDQATSTRPDNSAD